MKKNLKLKKVISFTTLCAMLLMNTQEAEAALRPTAAEFPEKTIIIGTHAIVIEYLTTDLLETAEKSASDNNQNKVYFKSDLSEGTWYDITNSMDITEISDTVSNVVKNEYIDALYLTHYTNAKGETINLLTGQTGVPQTDLRYPVNMEELSGIQEEYQTNDGFRKSAEKNEDNEKEKAYKKACDALSAVMDPNPLLENPEIQNAQKALDSMDAYIRFLKATNASLEVLNEVAVQKEGLQQKKDALCYSMVLSKIESELDNLEYMAHGELIAKFAEYSTAIRAKLAELNVEIPEVEDPPTEEDTGNGIGSGSDEGTGNDAESESGEGTNNNTGSESDEDTGTGTGSGSTAGSSMEGSALQPVDTAPESYQTALKEIYERESRHFLEAVQAGDFAKANEKIAKIIAAKQLSVGDFHTDKEGKEQQKKVLEEAKSAVEATINQMALMGALGNNFIDAAAAGESELVLQKYAEQGLEVLKSAIDDLDTINDMLGILAENQAEYAEALDVACDSLQNAIDNMLQSVVAEEAKTALREQLDKMKETSDEIKLSTIPAYVEAKKNFDDLTEQAKALNEEYLSAAEEGNTDGMDAYKARRNAAVEKMIAAENHLEDVIEAYENGKVLPNLDQLRQDAAEKDVSNGDDTSGTGNTGADGSGTGNTGANGSGTGNAGANGSEAGNTGADGLGTGNAGANGSETGNAGAEDSEEEGMIQQEQREDALRKGYTNQEINQILEEAKVLHEETNQEFVGPWFLEFDTYSVKLMEPLLKENSDLYVPAQDLTRQLGGQVYKNKHTGVYVLKNNGAVIEYELNDNTIFVNHKKMVLKKPVTIFHNKAYLSLEAFEEAYSFIHGQSGEYVILY